MRLLFGKKTKRPAKDDFIPGDREETSYGEGSQPAITDLELTHVGSYEIIAPIGTGGMGTVYKAIDRQQDSTVAIKVLDRRYDLDRKRRKRDYLGREILIAASGEANDNETTRRP